MLAVLTTHPIQTQTPLWRRLAERGSVPFRVFFLSRQGLDARHDPEFGQAVQWDVNQLSGYPHEFLAAREMDRNDSFFWLRLDAGLDARLEALGARVLWVQGWQVAAYWQAVWRAKRRNLPVWMRGDTNLRSRGVGGTWRARAKKPLFDWLFGSVDTFLCTGNANRRFYVAQGISAKRLVSAPHCVDNARFSEQAARLRPERARLRAAWGVPENAFCVLFAGKLIEKKRPLDLIAASARANALAPERPIHVLAAGTGALAQQVRAACRVVFDAERSDVATAVPPGAPTASFLGFVNQSRLPEVYAAADCLALPSDATETWGLVVNEAMASGLPAVVSAEVGCAEDLVAPLGARYVFPLGDVDAQARALLSMAAAPPAADAIAERIALYHPDRTIETVERLYAALDR